MKVKTGTIVAEEYKGGAIIRRPTIFTASAEDQQAWCCGFRGCRTEPVFLVVRPMVDKDDGVLFMKTQGACLYHVEKFIDRWKIKQ